MSIADSSYVKGDGELGREESATVSRFVMSSLFGKPNDDVIFFLVVVYKKRKGKPENGNGIKFNLCLRYYWKIDVDFI